MSDFAITFRESVIPASALTTDLAVETADVTKAFLIPSMYPHQTAGIGRNDGIHEDSLASSLALANLIDADTIRFTDHSSGVFNNLVGCNLMEYVGPAGGVNEVIVRGVVAFGGTAAQFDSGAIAGIVDIAKCVPFIFEAGSLNSGAWQSHAGTAQVVNDGVNNVVRINKVNVGNTLNVVAFVVEFVGSNWTVQKVTHNYAVSNTDENEAISAVVLAKTFIYNTWKPAQNLPRDATHFVWLSSTTQVRHRVRGSVTGTPVSVSYVISNPQLNVQVVGADPDGTEDLNATGTVLEVRDIAITSVPNPENCIVLGFAGSYGSAAAARPAVLTMMNLLDNDTVRLRRSISDSGTEYKIQVIDFSAVVGLAISNVTPLVDGANFTISGNFGALTGDGVTLGGVVQAAVSANSTTIVRTATLGTLKYGEHTLIVTAGGTVEVPDTTINPPATKNFVNLGALTIPSGRLTSTPDLATGDQVEWSNVVGGAITDVNVADDGSFSVSPGVTAFDFRVNDGTGWGTIATQTIGSEAGQTTNFTIPMTRDFTRLMLFDFTDLRRL